VTAVADARIAVDVPTAVAAVPIAADVPAGLDSNAVPAAQGMTAATRAVIPAHRAVRNSFPKC
jgi:hypothetical protein